MHEALSDRFWAKVDRGPDCWAWKGAVSGNGYASVKLGGRQVAAHRVSWEIDHDRPVGPGLIVMHACDNPMCVRPDHLMEGTHLDNARDRDAKGRGARGDTIPPETRARGERHPDAILTESAVRDIRSSTDSLHALARRYGVSVQAVWRAFHRKTWRHVG